MTTDLKTNEDTEADLLASITSSISRDPRLYAIKVTSYWIKTSRSAANGETSIWLEGDKYKFAANPDFAIRFLFKSASSLRQPILKKDQPSKGVDRIEVHMPIAQMPMILHQLRDGACFVVINQIGTSGARSDVFSYSA